MFCATEGRDPAAGLRQRSCLGYAAGSFPPDPAPVAQPRHSDPDTTPHSNPGTGMCALTLPAAPCYVVGLMRSGGRG